MTTDDAKNTSYPGSEEHQRLLAAIVRRYAEDARVRAIIIFGSVGRGNWDAYSDLDLDIILVDDVSVDAVAEVRTLETAFAAIGEELAIIIPKREDEADVVLVSLRELSLRYHTLAMTSPNIIESMRVLAGTLDHATIAAAGAANQHDDNTPPGQLVDRCVRQVVEALVALQRNRLWFAVEFLHDIRALLIELFGVSHGAVRALHTFQAQADAELHDKLGATLPLYSLDSARICLLRSIALLEDDLPAFTAGMVALDDRHRALLRQVKAHLAV